MVITIYCMVLHIVKKKRNYKSMLDLYEFKNVNGHIEVYNKENGNFIVSDDTLKEAVSSLLEILYTQ